MRCAPYVTRSSPSDAALFTEWTRGVAAGVVYYEEVNKVAHGR
jgi:hypothetical protein